MALHDLVLEHFLGGFFAVILPSHPLHRGFAQTLDQLRTLQGFPGGSKGGNEGLSGGGGGSWCVEELLGNEVGELLLLFFLVDLHLLRRNLLLEMVVVKLINGAGGGVRFDGEASFLADVPPFVLLPDVHEQFLVDVPGHQQAVQDMGPNLGVPFHQDLGDGEDSLHCPGGGVHQCDFRASPGGVVGFLFEEEGFRRVSAMDQPLFLERGLGGQLFGGVPGPALRRAWRSLSLRFRGVQFSENVISKDELGFAGVP